MERIRTSVDRFDLGKSDYSEDNLHIEVDKDGVCLSKWWPMGSANIYIDKKDLDFVIDSIKTLTNHKWKE